MIAAAGARPETGDETVGSEYAVTGGYKPTIHRAKGGDYTFITPPRMYQLRTLRKVSTMSTLLVRAINP